ncbi:hypothetical protein [Burkholderia phage FLC8]|nr:hypothetical protein [Burkholderia phage FLC8]
MDKNISKMLMENALDPFRAEVHYSRKQMFSNHGIEDTREFEDHMRKIIHDAIALPSSVLYGAKSLDAKYMSDISIKYMRQGLKVHRCITKKAKHMAGGDINYARAFLRDQARSVDDFQLFDRWLNAWMQSSLILPNEYWEQVIWNERFHRTFVERKLGVYTSADGWKIENEDIPGEELWALRDPYGVCVAELPRLHDFEDKYPYTLINYEKRFGRHGHAEMDIKYGPAHFPKGTIVEVNPEHKDHLGNNRFTVDHIVVMGARNYLLVMQEIKPGVPGSAFILDEPRQYNMHHVWKIVKRGDGKVDLRDDFPQYRPIAIEELLATEEATIEMFSRENSLRLPHLNKDERFVVNLSRLVSCILNSVGRRPENQGKWLDEGKLHRFMVQRNFGRFVTLYGPNDDKFESFYVFNIKKMVAWIRDHQHQLFMTLRQVEKLEEEMDRKEAEDFARLMD